MDTIQAQNEVKASLDGSIEILRGGVFNFTTFPNMYKEIGGQVAWDIWYQLDHGDGNGWVTEPYTGSRYTMLANTNNTDQVIDFPYRGLVLKRGWKIRFMVQVEDTAIYLKTVPEDGLRPVIPANFINVEWLGG